jgi:hypothetical protein
MISIDYLGLILLYFWMWIFVSTVAIVVIYQMIYLLVCMFMSGLRNFFGIV